MGVAHLSEAWLDRWRELAADLPEQPGASGTIAVTVLKAPGGDVTYHLTFEDGRLVAAGLGDGDAPVALTQTHADALAVLDGTLDVVVGVMRGKVKYAGDTGVYLALQPVLQSDAHRAVLAALAAETDRP